MPRNAPPGSLQDAAEAPLAGQRQPYNADTAGDRYGFQNQARVQMREILEALQKHSERRRPGR